MTNQGYQVIARRWRPKQFSELVGQDHIVRTLTNAIENGRIAHAYLFVGPRGTGKTSTARLFAKALNAEGGPKVEIDDSNEISQSIMNGSCMDVIEIDGASNNSVDQIRSLREECQYAPAQCTYKIYIIDEVHMLTTAAFNALLKTLEEPPDHVKFIFATTEIRKVPITILSRCQRFDLQRVLSDKLIEHLKWVCDQENIKSSLEALQIIARVSGGSVRDALSLLDQSASISSDDIKSETISFMLGLPSRVSSIEILEKTLKGDISEALKLFDTIINSGSNSETMISDMLDILHLSTRMHVLGPENENISLLSIPEGERTGIKRLAENPLSHLTRAWQILLKGLEEIRSAPNLDEAGSMILIRLGYSSNLPDPATLVKKIKASMDQPQNNKPKTELTNSSNKDIKEIDNTNDSQQKLNLENFEQLVELFRNKGELLIHAQLLSCVHLVSFEKGKLEIRISGNTDKSIAKDMSSHLKHWTGISWIVNLVEEKGSETLDEKKERIIQEELEATKKTPEMEKVLKAFPNADLKSVKDIEE